MANLLAVMAGRQPTAHYDGALRRRSTTAHYDGYSSCPITTARVRMPLCEFDYSLQPHPSFPLVDTPRERYDMWLVKRYGLPFMYWNLMLRGLA